MRDSAALTVTLCIASCFEIVDGTSGKLSYASTPFERTDCVLDGNGVPRIVVGDGIRIAARKIVVERSRVRFNAFIERNMEPP